jgi:sugar O-acyltransferase (sialic acid O-acetyltransferase NeuD family)
MKKPLVIFGAGDIGELAHWYFSRDSQYEVKCFTVDREYAKEATFCGLPVVPLDELPASCPPAECSAFVALSYARVNALRRDKYLALKQAGYAMASYVSSRASILNDHAIGENCFILEDNTVQPFVRIGDNVTLWSGNHIGHHSTIASHTFIASHVVVSGGVQIGEACFIGVNATLRDHIRIGEQCVIGAGALLLEDAEARGVYLGPATERSRVPSNRLRGI